ncbi:MAG: class I SAM-dependent methyltransferase [Prevotella sp.]|nr:class I SAM-dependent methyltransferase [Prevotella sp.]
MNVIKKFYDDFSEFWMENPRFGVRSAYLGMLGNVNGKSVLDIGCGCGFDIELLSNKGAHGIGIDFSENAIQQSRLRIGNNNNWKLVCADFMDYTPQHQFNIVLFSMVVMHYMDLYAVFNKLSSFVKRDGLLLLVTNNPYLVKLDYNLPYPTGNTCIPYEHHFNIDGREVNVKKYLHSFSNYINNASINQLAVNSMQEIEMYSQETRFFNPVPHASIPNFITILYSKN